MASSTLSLSFLGLRSLAFPSPWLLLEGPGFILSRLTLISGAFSVWSTGVSDGRTISDLSSLSSFRGFAGLAVLSGLLTRRSKGSVVLIMSVKERRTLTPLNNGMQASNLMRTISITVWRMAVFCFFYFCSLVPVHKQTLLEHIQSVLPKAFKWYLIINLNSLGYMVVKTTLHKSMQLKMRKPPTMWWFLFQIPHLESVHSPSWWSWRTSGWYRTPGDRCDTRRYCSHT